ncbi:DNA-3-methyladenine glycosylase [Achromobacter insolitus]|uniref:DNA-3-methyladenine glycosylase n=1 Tax=Achromobacter insolitus TaxID=217204 RepID=UPI00244EEC30|nr:DNA-3-methyladenine glycosylase [Achromobacter insolitus]MDH3063378.1 DNA-3-methyladenine glycosylase [Achromobacter insolitus]
MDREELLAQMIATPATDRGFHEWPEVLANYAECLAALQPRLRQEEMERLIRVGADFYRTLARAEQYRHTSVWDEQQP